MQIKHLKIGQKAKRGTYPQGLYIARREDNQLYYEGNTRQGDIAVTSYSSAHEKHDFILLEDNTMTYTETKYLIINSKDNHIKRTATEDEAIEYIEEALDANPRAKFTVLTPAFKVEPKRTKLIDLIKRIK